MLNAIVLTVVAPIFQYNNRPGQKQQKEKKLVFFQLHFFSPEKVSRHLIENRFADRNLVENENLLANQQRCGGESSTTRFSSTEQLVDCQLVDRKK